MKPRQFREATRICCGAACERHKIRLAEEEAGCNLLCEGLVQREVDWAESLASWNVPFALV